MGKSKIEWCDDTWNCVRGCSPVSAGCENCYASRMASRFSGPGGPYEGLAKGGKWTGEVRAVPEKLEEPLHWRKPRRVFVNSMSDLFHPDVPDEFIAAVFGVMAACPQHTFQILTKRAERLPRWNKLTEWIRTKQHLGEWLCACASVRGTDLGDWKRLAIGWPLPNVMLGVSAENQKAADERLIYLRDTPAAVRFVSHEPAIGPWNPIRTYAGRMNINALEWLDWIVMGGESGPGARPMHPDWVRSIRDQCQAAGVPFMFKQWGEWAPAPGYGQGAGLDPDNYKWPGKAKWIKPDGDELPSMPGDCDQWGPKFGPIRVAESGAINMWPVGKKAAGRQLDGREYMEFPNAPESSGAKQESNDLSH